MHKLEDRTGCNLSSVIIVIDPKSFISDVSRLSPLKFKSFDVGFPDLAHPEDYVKLAQSAEKYGFGCIWLQEGTSWDPMTISALILSRTRNVNVGTGVVSIFKRHPEVLSTEAATLSELSDGRFILGI